MAKTVIINAKGSPKLKEAIQLAAIEQRHEGQRVSASAYIIKVLEADPLIKKHLKKLK